MKYWIIFTILILFWVGSKGQDNLKIAPPHCTHLSKETDYVSRFRLDYPVVYIHPGQREAYQPMYCLNPAGVSKEVSVVCDWAAPPLVQFSLGDEHLHVVRQDPTGRYSGNAVITTYQACNHSIPPHLMDEKTSPTVSEILNGV